MNGKVHTVKFTDHAKIDLVEIGLYFLENVGERKAAQVINALEKKCGTLRCFPHRGHHVPELADVGLSEYREVHMENYRVIYTIRKSRVYVIAVLDSRRDIESQLLMRLSR